MVSRFVLEPGFQMEPQPITEQTSSRIALDGEPGAG